MKSSTTSIAIVMLTVWTFGCFQTVAAQDKDSTAAEQNSVASLNWLAGTWKREIKRDDKVASTTQEHWMQPKGELMLGLNRTVGSGKQTQFEFLRIANSGTSISYFASPGGKSATEFRLKTMTDDRVVFENLDHDFPQRIIYHREGDKLTARIEGTSNGNESFVEWKYLIETK